MLTAILWKVVYFNDFSLGKIVPGIILYQAHFPGDIKAYPNRSGFLIPIWHNFFLSVLISRYQSICILIHFAVKTNIANYLLKKWINKSRASNLNLTCRKGLDIIYRHSTRWWEPWILVPYNFIYNW